MKGKQLGIVLGLLVVLGGGALLVSRRDAGSWRESATVLEGKILNFPLNDVAHVTIKDSAGELNLIKKESGWTVKERADYPADFDKVSTLIRTLWELRAIQDVKIGPSQLGRVQLTAPGQDANSGTLLELKGAGDKRLAALLLGKTQFRNSDQTLGQANGIPAGRYVMAQDNSNRVFLISETLDETQTKPEQWLDRDFVKIENPKSITLAGVTPAQKWKLVRDNASAPWKFSDAKAGEEPDPGKVSSLAGLFASAIFTDVLPPDASVAETGLGKPSTATFETFDNFVYELRIGKAMGENYAVLVSVKADLPKERTPGKDEKPEEKTRLDQEFQTKQKTLTDKLAKEQKLDKRPYLIAKSTIDQLLKDRSALLPDKTTESSPTPAKLPAAKAAPTSTSTPRKRP